MSTLLKNYLAIEPKLEIVYVYPAFDQKVLVNDYLQLLYKPLIESEQKLVIKSISIRRFPLLFLQKISGKKIIVHHHWYEANNGKKFIQLLWRTFWLLVFRLFGGKIVWTVHNRYPHDTKYKTLNKFFRSFFAKIVTKLHVHCSSAVKEMSQILKVKTKKFFVVEHPLYDVNIMPQEQALKQLTISIPKLDVKTSDIIFLAFGQIAPYKGLLPLVQLFSQLEENFKLIIAGKTKKGKEEYVTTLKSFADKDPRIILLNRLIKENEIDLLFNSANYVIFNFVDILTSGGVMLALSYDKPIIIPNIGCLKEIKGKTVIKFNSFEELRKIILSLLKGK